MQLSNENEYKEKLTCIPGGSTIIIFAPSSYIKTEGKYKKVLHPNITKMIDMYIKYRTNDYMVVDYSASENHSFGCTYDFAAKEAKVYTSTSVQPVHTYVFE